MAQENSPDKEKRQGRTKKPEKPYVEQIDELLLVHNKNDPKEGLGVVSKADEKGNYQTVAPEEKNENSFLKFEYPRKFYQELLEPAEGTYAFQAYPHDLQRLQAEQTGSQGPGRRQENRRGKGVSKTL